MTVHFMRGLQVLCDFINDIFLALQIKRNQELENVMQLVIGEPEDI